MFWIVDWLDISLSDNIFILVVVYVFLFGIGILLYRVYVLKVRFSYLREEDVIKLFI